MSDSLPTPDPATPATPGLPALPGDDLDRLAGEYVLGTLSAARRRAVEARLPRDAALRGAVDAWEARLLPLAALAAPADPSAQLWPRIARSVEMQAVVARAYAPAVPVLDMPVAGASGPAADAPTRPVPGNGMPGRRPAVPAARSGLGHWWHSLQLWRGLAASGFAAAAVLAAVLVQRDAAAPAGPQYLVVLVAPQDKAPGWVVQARSPQSVELIPLGRTEVPREKSLQFWTKADGWQGPVSLGLVQPGQTVRIPLDKLPPLQPDQLFELTLEPAAGSPLDRPTGPIQFIGRAVKVT